MELLTEPVFASCFSALGLGLNLGRNPAKSS